MKKLLNIKYITSVLFLSVILIIATSVFAGGKENTKTESVVVRSVSSTVLADGKIASQNEAKLQFQTGGKLTYLPFKEGDSVSSGQVIASIDSYVIQKQFQAALNNYRSVRDTFDQTKDNTQNDVQRGIQKYSLEVTNRGGFSGQPEEDIINDMVKRIVDQNQANLDNSVINVELSNYAMQLASLTSPIDGIIVHEDVTVPFVNITPATSFLIIDPNSLVFRAYISEQDIDFVGVGAQATIRLNSNSEKSFTGKVVKIYPQKTTLSNGRSVYQADIESDELKGQGHYDEAGSVQIASNVVGETKLVPAWTILDNQYLWVEKDGKKNLKKIKVGKNHGDFTEVLGGLDTGEQVIVNPESVVKDHYSIL